MPASPAVTTQAGPDSGAPRRASASKSAPNSPPQPTAGDRTTTRLYGRWHRLRAQGRRHAYLVVAAAGVMVLTRLFTFEPPEQVRTGTSRSGELVGEAPSQEFTGDLSNPQALQLRATLRLYADNALPVASPDPELDPLGQVISQPVVTTIYGMNASVSQTVRLEGGDLEVEIMLDATPRLEHPSRTKTTAGILVLEHHLRITSRRTGWLQRKPLQRVHLDDRGLLLKVDEHGHRVVFTVDGHLLTIDLEIHRGTNPPANFARNG